MVASSPVDVDTALITDKTDTEAVDQPESSPDVRLSSVDHDASGSSINLATSLAHGDATESDCWLADTAAKSLTTTAVSHVTSHAGDCEMQFSPAVVCIDSEIASPAAVTAVCSPEQVHVTTTSPVIDVDGDDDAVVDKRESGVSKKVKERLIDAWHSQTHGALKSAVNRAVAHVSASRGPDTVSPVSVNSDVLPSVAVTSPAVTTCTVHVPPQTSHTGSQSQAARAAEISRASDATVPQSDVPTARVIGRIVSVRRPSPLVPSTAHQTATTSTPCLNVVSTSVVAASAAASVAPAAAAQMPIATASSSSLYVSSAAKSRGSVSSRSMRGGGARRPRRPRRVTHLGPEDLYEISSQIVTEMLQWNKQQSSEMDDVITCEDDDDDVGIVDMVDGQSGHFYDDVMIIGDDHGANPKAVDVPVPTIQPAHHPRAPRPTSSKTTAGSRTGVAAAAVRTWKKLLIPSPSQVVAPSHRQRVNTSDDVTVLDIASQVAEDTDELDVVCCDEDTRDAIPAGPRRLTAAVPAPHSKVSASAGDDDVLICDTPAPSETEACTSNTRRHVSQSDKVPGGCLGRRSTAVSGTITQGCETSPAANIALTLPRPDIPVDDDDDVVLVDASNPSFSETSQGDTLQCSSSSSVIILD